MLPLRVFVVMVMASLVGENLIAQSPWNCTGAIPICGNDTISITSGPLEYDDFSNPNNDRGCLSTGEGQHSTWLYFEFRDDMPQNSALEMTLFPPDPSVGWEFEDFDFAIYGPNLNCDSLGNPRRCSFARSLCSFCPYTGMGRDALDSQEDAFIDPIDGEEVDGYVLPLVVQPGDRFYMLVTKFTGFSTAFAVEWGGVAADYFNCISDPACINIVNAGPDLSYCKSDTFDVRLDAQLETNSNEEVIIEWTGNAEAMTFLDSAFILKPKVTIPSGFTGVLEYEIRVLQGACDRTDKVKIEVLGSPEPVILQAEMVCQGQLTSLEVDDIYDSYLWSDGSIEPTIEAVTGQTYSIIVSAGNCQGVDTFLVESFPNSVASLKDSAAICGDQPTTLSLENSFESYVWSDNSTESTLEVNTPGAYSVTVTDVNSCVTSDSIIVAKFDEPVINLSQLRSACEGETITVNTVENFETYAWSTGEDTPSISVTEPGDYSLVVTDANGCQNSELFELTFHPNPSPVIEGDTNMCIGTTHTLRVLDSSSYNTIEWTTNATSPSIDISVAGQYGVTVEDDFGCVGSTSVNLIQRDNPVLDIENTASFCPGTTVELKAGEGHAGYLWSDGSTEPNLVVSQQGEVQVTVANEYGCTNTGIFQVSEIAVTPPEIQGPIGLCPDEEATLSVNAVYQSYQWSTGSDATSPSIDITTGIEQYAVTVVDENACVGTDTIDIQNFSISEVIIEGDPFICDGDSTILKVNTGMAAYLWSTGSTSPEITIKEAREYAVTITDNNGCSQDLTFTVSQAEIPALNLEPEFQICRGSSLTLDMGDTFEQYEWSDGNTSSVINISEEGSYSLTVTAASGCQLSKDFSVSLYDEPEVTFQGVPGFCPGESTTISVEGSWAAIHWSTGDTSSSISVSSDATITAMVEDNAGCVGEGSIDIAAFNVEEPEIQGPEEVCPDEAFSLKVEDNYRDYQWSIPGATTTEVFPDTAGYFDLRVTDNNGCILTAEWQVMESPSPILNLAGDDQFCANASANLVASGNFVSIEWNTLSFDTSIVVDQEGWYTALATGENGCTSLDSLFIEKLELPQILIGDSQVLDCINASVTLGDTSINSSLYSFEWNGPNLENEDRTQSQLVVADSGWYSLVIENIQTGCRSLADSVRVEDVRYTPQIGLGETYEIDCDNPTVTVRDTLGQNANFQYQWYNSARELISTNNRPEISIGTAGILYLQVLDTTTGCDAMDSVRVIRNSEFPEVVAVASGPVTCDQPSISIHGSVVGAGPDYEVTWEIIEGALVSNGDHLSAEATAAGTYVLFVENTQNGCLASDTIVINENLSPPSAIAGMDQTLDCFTGEASLQAQPTEAKPLDFSWTFPNGSNANGQSITTDLAGTYILTVIDPENGCSATDEVQVFVDDNQPTGLEIEIDHPDCKGEEDGMIKIAKVEGGKGPYLFQMNDLGFSDNTIFDNLKPDSYTFTVQDVSGCVYTTEVRVNDGREITIDLGEDQEVEKGEEVVLKPFINLPTNEIGSLLLTNNEGNSCDSCFTSWTFVPEFSSVYVAKLTDENGCVAEDKVRILVRLPRDLYVPNAFSPNDDGLNDRFMIYSNEDVKMIKLLKIFDRWGDMVFQNEDFSPNDYGESWDGYYRNKPMNVGVYVFYMEVEYSDGETAIIEGDVTVVK